MATRKTASKTSKKAESGISLNLSKKSKNSAKKVARKVGLKALIIFFACLVLGAAIGSGAWAIVCRNDCFEIVGQDNISLQMNETYTDEGVKIVAFGRDEKQSVSIETDLTKNEDGTYSATDVGTYYIKYISSCLKYGKIFKVEKIRLITFVEESEGGE